MIPQTCRLMSPDDLRILAKRPSVDAAQSEDYWQSMNAEHVTDCATMRTCGRSPKLRRTLIEIEAARSIEGCVRHVWRQS